MADSMWKLAILVSLLSGVAAPTQADDRRLFEGDGVEDWLPADPIRRNKEFPSRTRAVGSRLVDLTRPTTTIPQPAPTGEWPSRVENRLQSTAGPVHRPTAILWETPDWTSRTAPLMSAGRSLTETEPLPEAAPKSSADGTWREEGRYIIINLNGQELKLLRTAPVAGQDSRQTNGASPVEYRANMSSRAPASGGAVYGRLSHGGRPLPECRVSLVPLQKTYGGYKVDGAKEPQSAVTDEQGNYRFEGVPAGPYKLFWMPKATNQWIRRIAFRPDVFVRNDKTSQVKEIRVSLRTIN